MIQELQSAIKYLIYSVPELLLHILMGKTELLGAVVNKGVFLWKGLYG